MTARDWKHEVENGVGSLVSGYMLCSRGRNRTLSSMSRYGEHSYRQCVGLLKIEERILDAGVREKYKVQVIEVQVTLM